MKLQKVQDEIRGLMNEAVYNALYNEEKTACATLNLNDGYIDLWVNTKGDVEAVVSHDDRTKDVRRAFRLETFCEKILEEFATEKAWDKIAKENEYDLTPEEEYSHRGEAMFSRNMQWHRF